MYLFPLGIVKRSVESNIFVEKRLRRRVGVRMLKILHERLLQLIKNLLPTYPKTVLDERTDDTVQEKDYT